MAVLIEVMRESKIKMNIAAITITYNDGYKINEWYEHYCGYKDDIALHIIVDNDSDEVYFQRLSALFSDSTILRRDSNGGCTGAYNEGIKYALAQGNIDAIMLIANDIKMDEGSIEKLNSVLFSRNEIGMVAPLLLYSDSLINSDFGCSISNQLLMEPYCDGVHVDDIAEELNQCDALTGGINIAKRDFYLKVGLQDELLFMYSDEVDMGLRAKKHFFKMVAVSSARSWHQHINENKNRNSRASYTKYLGGRNKVYVAKKHFGGIKSFKVFGFFTLGALYKLFLSILKLNIHGVQDYSWMILGCFMGLIGNMDENKFSKPRN